MKRREIRRLQAVRELADVYWRAQLKRWPLSRIYGKVKREAKRRVTKTTRESSIVTA